jgi:hypothetical protein
MDRFIIFEMYHPIAALYLVMLFYPVVACLVLYDIFRTMLMR